MSCIFCCQTPLTKAHIVPKALHPLLEQNFVGRESMQLQTRGLDENMEWKFSQPGREPHAFQPKVLCAKCNNDWMNRIEKDAIATARRLIQGERFTLTPDLMRAIATWAATMAILLSETHGHDCHFPEKDRVEFRATSVPPETMVVGIVWTYLQPTIPPGGGGRRIMLPASDITHATGPNDPPGELAVIWLGQLCILVANRSGIAEMSSRGKKFNEHIEVIWPTPETSIPWPPRTQLPMQGFARALQGGRPVDELLERGIREIDRRRTTNRRLP